MSEFKGFGPKTRKFLRDLGANNNKVWFDANRADYEAHYLEPAKDFIEAVSRPLKKIAPGIQAEPRVNGSIFRINRDIRFSKDKTPYKDHLDLWFWEGERKTAVSGLFFRLTDKSLILGAGAHMMAPDRLKLYRQRVADKKACAKLKRAVTAIEKAGLEAHGQHYAKLPRGFSADDDRTEALLRHNALWTESTGKHPKSLNSPDFVVHCIGVWKSCAPLHRWLVDEMT